MSLVLFCVALFQQYHLSRIGDVSKFDDSMINLHSENINSEIFHIHALQKCVCCVSCKRFPPLGGRVFVFETLQTHTRMGRSVFPLENEYNGTCLLGVACNRLDWSPRIPIDVLQKRALSLASSNKLFSFSVNRDHTIRVRGFVHKQDLIIGNLTTPVTVCTNRRLRDLDTRRDRCSTHPFSGRDALSVFSAVADLRLDGPC